MWRGGKIIKPFEVLDKRTSGCFTMPSAKKFAADFVEKKKTGSINERDVIYITRIGGGAVDSESIIILLSISFHLLFGILELKFTK